MLNKLKKIKYIVCLPAKLYYICYKINPRANYLSNANYLCNEII